MVSLIRRRIRITTLAVLCYSGLICGIGFAHLEEVRIAATWTCAACIIAGLTVLIVRRQNIIVAAAIIVLSCCLGNYHGGLFERRIAAYDSYFGQKITITGQAKADAVYGSHSQLSFTVGDVVLPNGRHPPGRIDVSGFGLNAVYAGDTITATGKLRPGYGSEQGDLSFAKLQYIRSSPSAIDPVRRRFAAGVQSALPEPLAPFALGLLVGQRATLPKPVKDDLLHVGLTHIIAVSGYNVTIIMHAVKRVLGKRSKRLSLLLSLSLMSVFLLLTGASASIVRAAIVSVVSLTAAYYGHAFKPLNLLLLAAALTAWVNPLYVWGDMSWYLSFLAFFGVLAVAPLFQDRLPERWRHSMLLGVAIESISAEIVTLPYVLHVFGQMSLIGLPANILVVALIPLAMLFSLFAGLAGMFIASMSGWIALPARVLLTYMLDTAHILAGLPHVFVEHLGFSLGQMLAAYCLILFTVYVLARKTKPSRYAIITDKKQMNLQGETLERT